MATVFREIARGIGFTEGPLWTPNGSLLIASVSRGKVYELDLASEPDRSVVAAVETGGGPNGLAASRGGDVYVAQNSTFRTHSERPVRSGLQRLDHSCVVDIPLPESVAPNDLAFGPDGALWFTDPRPSEELPPRVRRWIPSEEHATTVADSLRHPNGLAFSADGRWLYVADSREHDIVRFPVEGTRLGSPERFALVPESNPDGIAFDRASNLYIASFDLDAVVVLDPDGAEADRLDTGAGSRPTNLCFAGASLDTLVVTLASGGRVVATSAPETGLPL